MKLGFYFPGKMQLLLRKLHKTKRESFDGSCVLGQSQTAMVWQRLAPAVVGKNIREEEDFWELLGKEKEDTLIFLQIKGWIHEK